MSRADAPLVVLVGATGSGKSSLANCIAQAYTGEVISCDSVAVYRGLDIGSAKPSLADRERIRHHGLDLLEADQHATAGGYARAMRTVLDDCRERSVLPVLAGGTGLYLRATLDGLAPAPPRDEALRARLRALEERRGTGALHRLLRRVDRPAAAAIHANDVPKLIRSLETTLLGKRPQSAQWDLGREPLRGFRQLRIGLAPDRQLLYERLNGRAARMFEAGLLEEAAVLAARFGDDAFALNSLGYKQALAVLRGRMSLPEAVRETQQGHRNYAKRQMTWFRREADVVWLEGFGDDAAIQAEALHLVQTHLNVRTEGDLK